MASRLKTGGGGGAAEAGRVGPRHGETKRLLAQKREAERPERRRTPYIILRWLWTKLCQKLLNVNDGSMLDLSYLQVTTR